MNEKNLAPKNIEGTYTLTIEGKTITITDSSGHTKTANCAPDDIFNLGEGVNLAMNRLHDKTIRVGDIVKVIRPGQCYTTYVGWIERNVKSIREAALYRYNESIEAGGSIEFFIWPNMNAFLMVAFCAIFKSTLYIPVETLRTMRRVI